MLNGRRQKSESEGVGRGGENRVFPRLRKTGMARREKKCLKRVVNGSLARGVENTFVLSRLFNLN